MIYFFIIIIFIEYNYFIIYTFAFKLFEMFILYFDRERRERERKKEGAKKEQKECNMYYF